MKYCPSLSNLFCSTRISTATLCFGLSLFAGGTVCGQSPSATLVRVEEDWVALVAEPDTGISSPQIMNFISPIQSTSGVFGLVQVNHRGDPEFRSGGLQVQGWVGSWLSGSAQADKNAVLHRSGDNLRYTVAMERVDSGIRFELLNGRSRTWGRFARTPVSVTVAVDDPTLEYYSPEFSVANTNVNVGAHRVDVLYLTATRLRYSDGTILTDNTDRVIHRYQLSVQDVPLDVYEQNIDDYNTDITE